MTIHPSGHDSSGEHSRRNKNKNPRQRRQPTASSRHRKERGQSSYKFVDRARIRVSGGAGGNGSMSNQHMGRYKRRPDGGHGGDGGAVILVADPNEQTLGMSLHHHTAEDGKPGGVRAMNGRRGKNNIVRVPCGVIVRRVLDYDEYWDSEERMIRKYELNQVEGGEEEGDEIYSASNGNVISYQSNSSLDDDDTDFDIFGDDDSYGSSSSEEENELECIDDDQEAFSYNDGENEDESNSGLEGRFEDKGEDEDESHEHNSTGKYDGETMSDENLVNTGIKASDGMYHWRPDDYGSSSTSQEDEWVSSSSEIFNYEREKVVIADLDKPGSSVVLATGGRGGTGSIAYAKKQWTPGLMANAGERRVGKPGETAHLELELKLIADIGLVGWPNAGKSSLLASMSMARPEIAPYPFTTLHPLVGTIKYRDGFRVIAADVPGLVDGAAEGRGRGHDFLRHLERTKSLLFIVDAAGVDGRTPVDDLRILAEEIASYGDGGMMNRPSLLVANKLDLIPEEEEREGLLFELAVAAEEAGIDYRGEILGISAGVTGEGLGPLSKAMRRIVTEAEARRIISEAA
jgi:Obg family GTPase CgtA